MLRQADPVEAVAPARRLNLTAVQYLLLALAAAHVAIGTMAANYWQITHPERVLLIAAVQALLACAVAFTLARFGVPPWTAFFVVLVAAVIFVRGGPILQRLDSPLSWVAVAAPIPVAWYVSRRLPGSALWVASVALVVALVSGPLLDALSTVGGMGESQVRTSPVTTIEMAERPNIYLVVLDAYAGRRALAGQFGEPKADLVEDLETLGFQLPSSAWSPYPSTGLAVPAVLDMSYPVDLIDVNGATERDLFGMVAGDSRTVSWLESNGYHTTMIESGWVGSSCGEVFDECIPSHWLDEVVFGVSGSSLAHSMVMERFGHAFTANALSTMDVVRDMVSAPRGEAPRFVFAHVLAPHPPFFLDRECALSLDQDRVELSMASQTTDPARDAYFLEQTECVDRFVLEMAQATGRDDVVIFLGDHGTRRHPSGPSLERPGDEAVLELMNVFVAGRVGDGCVLTDPILTSDLMRQVFSCLAETPLEPVPERMFLRGGYQMSAQELSELMNQG